MRSAGEAAPPVAGRMGAFVALELATLLAGVANAAVLVVLPWLVLERTGSGAAAGVVAAASAVPLVISSAFSGTVVDMLRPRRAAVISELLSALSVLAIAFVDSTLGLTVVLLVVFSVAGAMFDQLGVVARETQLPTVSQRTGMRMEAVNGWHEAVWGVALMAGPGLAGLLIAWDGPVFALWVLGGMFVAAGLLCLLVNVTPSDGHEPVSGFWASTKEGLSFAWNDKLLRAVGVLTVVLAMVYQPLETVVLPVHFQQLGQPGELGGLLLAMAAGAVVGALAYARVGHKYSRRAVFVLACVCSSVAFLGIVALPPYPVMVVLGVVVGALYGPIQPIANIAMQLRPPARLRGRVIGALTSVIYAAGPLGYLAAGALVSWAGVRTTLIVLAALTVLLILITTRNRALGEFDVLKPPNGVVVGADNG